MSRPSLPPSTPTKHSGFVYGSGLLPSLQAARSSRDDPDRPLSAMSTGHQELRALQNTVNRMMAKVPFVVRESVQATLELLMRKNEDLQTQLEAGQTETTYLRKEASDLRKQSTLAEKNLEVSRDRVKFLEERVGLLEEELETRRKYSVRNARYIDRLSSSNKLMIESLNCMQSKESSHGIAESDLKAILLKAVRDNYQCKQTLAEMERRLEDLRERLKFSEKQSRKFQLQLEEIKSTGAVSLVEVKKLEEGPMKRRNDGSVDERLEALMKKNSTDPVELLSFVRHVLGHGAVCPVSLDVNEVAPHFCRADIAKALAVDVIVVFLRVPDADIVYKYTPRTPKKFTDVIFNTDVRSVLSSVLLSENMVRSNLLDSNFNHEIDGCPGLVVTRVLSVPLRSKALQQVIGVVHFLNKLNGEFFTEVDEFMGSLYADQVSLALGYTTFLFRCKYIKSLLGLR